MPSSGAPAEFGFSAFSLPFHMLISVRDEDKGLRTTIANLPSQGPLVWNDLTFWGDPSDPVHDPERWGPLSGRVTPRPFMTNGAACDGPKQVRLSTETYETPGRWVDADATLPALTGCEQQQFAGDRQRAVPTRRRPARRPAGRSTSTCRRTSALDGLATPPVKDVVVRLPQGVVDLAVDLRGARRPARRRR